MKKYSYIVNAASKGSALQAAKKKHAEKRRGDFRGTAAHLVRKGVYRVTLV